MGLITGALQIGRSALLAYQSALQVVGNNVSNAGSAGYTRQTPVLTPATGVILPEGFTPGGGVALSALRRDVDASLENRIRYAMGDLSGSQVQQQTLGRIEGVLNELTDTDLSTLLQKLFNSFGQLQNLPQDVSARSMALTAGDALAQEIQRQRGEMLSLRDELNRDLVSTTEQANKLVEDIADLNVKITATESGNKAAANALRDQRDDLLRQLGEFMQIEVREQPDGGLNVYVGNEQLVQGGISRGLTTTLDTVNGEPKTVVRFADNGGPVPLLGGQLAGMVASRDTDVLGHVTALNQLADVLINEVNKLHAQGQGLEGFTSLLGATDVLSATAALNSTQAGLRIVPQNGSFMVTVTNKNSGVSQTVQISVDLDGIGTDDSLQSLVAQINAKVGNVTATATSDNRLRLEADSGFEFRFSEDSSNTLAALGMNTYFTGHDASDLAVNSMLTANPRLLAAALNSTPGDGANAGKIAALGTSQIANLGGRNLTDFYNGIATDVANRSAAAQGRAKAADAINASLSAQRESISGVSLDEETISLMRLERSFQGAARYTSTVDQLIQDMLAMVR